MSILVFGATGQVGRALSERPDVIALPRGRANLRDPSSCAKAIQDIAPRAVINAAAFTDVNGAEHAASTAHMINAHAPDAMARACAQEGVPLVQLSTDYVFAGDGHAPRPPCAKTAPLQVYGQSKLAGEDAVRGAGGAHAILRTSWVFAAWGHNFMQTMLRAGATRKRVSVVADQIGGPTPAPVLAEACYAIAHQLITAPEKSGTYHFTGAEAVSWADFARAIFFAAQMDVEVMGIPTTAYPTPAARPCNSRLDCSSTLATFGLRQPDWRLCLPGMTRLVQATRRAA